MALSIKHVSKTYTAPVLNDFSLEVGEGELVALTGPTGCGKTVLLRLLAGAEEASKGEMTLNGAPIGKKYKNTGVVLAPGSSELNPRKTVADNMAAMLKKNRLSREEIRSRSEQAAESLGISALLSQKVQTLSEGEKRLAAFAAALAQKPSALLLDDPFAGLDAHTREKAVVQLKKLQAETNMPILWATGDYAQAMGVADRIALMRGGVLVQADTPEEMYRCPASLVAAEFMGGIGSVEVSLRRDGNEMDAVFGENSLVVPRSRLSLFMDEECVGEGMVMALRAHEVSLERKNDKSAPVHGTVSAVRELGGEKLLTVALPGTEGALLVRAEDVCALKAGDEITVYADTSRLSFFSRKSGTALLGRE